MSKHYRGEGKVIKIDGQTADVASGRIYRKGNPLSLAANPTQSGNFVGVVQADITGTSSTLTTVDLRPIQVGDGVDGTQTGDGKGDMMVEGVHTLLVWGESAVISGSMACYMQVADFANPHSTLIASGVTRNGDYAVSGALVGFATENEYTGDAAPFTGRRVVDVKLLGNALHAIATTAP
jgi:hypothetical protein